MTSISDETSKVSLFSKYETVDVHGYPTETFSLDFAKRSRASRTRIFPHTVLVFIPGNPGLVDWYLRSFEAILNRLGAGFAARGVSNAGHGFEEEHVRAPANDETLNSIAHSVDGQSIHKVAYVDLLVQEFNAWRRAIAVESQAAGPSLPKWIFVSHSIGCHFIQRACVLQPNILENTRLFIHLTPFIRMSAPAHKQWLLNTVASHGAYAIATGKSVMTALKQLPRWAVNRLLQPSIPDTVSRNVTVSLLQQPEMATNFLRLGMQEVRDVPELFDLSAMNLVAKHCHSCLLIARDDQWFPESQFHELNHLIERKLVRNMSVSFNSGLKHGYILYPGTCERIVVDFCVDQILRRGSLIRARL